MRELPNAYRRTSAKDIAYTEVKQRILKGALQPTEIIEEDKISRELNISRTPLREAIQKLEFERLVLRLPNGRSKVTEISVKEVQEIYNVRSKLEEIAIVEAIDHITDEDIKHLEELIYQIERAYESGSIDELLYNGEAFHQNIYEMSRNKWVIDILSQLNDHLYRYRRFIPFMENTHMEKGAGHWEILASITSKDKQKAKAAITNHMENNLNYVVAAIESY